MQDEELDNRIREAASQHHPPYDDKAWEKMELLLDKHMPQEKDRKRWLFFLLPVLLLGGGLFLFIARPWQSSPKQETAQNSTVATITDNPAAKTNTAAENNNTNNGSATGSEPVSSNNPAAVSSSSPVAHNNSNTNTGNSNSPAGLAKTNPAVNDQTLTGNSSSPVAGTMAAGARKNKPAENNTAGGFNPRVSDRNRARSNNNKPSSFIAVNSRKKKNHPATLTPDDAVAMENGYDKKQNLYTQASKLKSNVQSPDAVEDPAINANTQNPAIAEKKAGEEKNKITTPVAEKSDNKTSTSPDKDKIAAITEKAKEVTPSAENKTKDKKKTPGGFRNNFGLSVSVGADVSFISTSKLGKATLLYGGGLSYTFAKRVTVRTGFYVSKKIYSATPDQYHNTIYPNLTGIDADCKIYQIPLSVSYGFGQRKNHSWFGSAGLTSLLMKKEDYEYNYKNSAGQTYSYYRYINNENKHYFSMLTLSAGYQRNLGKKVSVSAEPYVNIPLKGVGYGKIKLKTAGVQVSLTVKPFARNK